MIGKTVVVREVAGQTILSNRPAKRKRLSEKQKSTVRRFTEAQHYAKRRLQDPAMKELYQKGITAKKTSAYAVAVSDYLHSPAIHYIKAPDYDGAIARTLTVKLQLEAHVEVRQPQRLAPPLPRPRR